MIKAQSAILAILAAVLYQLSYEQLTPFYKELLCKSIASIAGIA